MANNEFIDEIILNVILEDGNNHMFMLKKSNQLQRLFIGVSRKFNYLFKLVQLRYKGHCIRYTDTAHSLRMINGDKVYVFYQNTSK